ncbi:RDD family protein [Psychroflexus planctonicus]|uniref:RDD family protein n=1 Tax=Psychroflexus planctonicus TaxID=1526575 RepID=A0ABQ1SLQ9_9FLAO|nr:RDD family protein [Psychroflexus planctonicus]GGE43199.1 RDD family protein [Psychroflexus planctonicus]
MNKFSIQTAQNITIQQQVATLTQRGFAYLIDGLIIIAYVIIYLFIANAAGMDDFESWAFNLTFFLPIFLYHLLFEIFNNGQSIGKKAFQIRVVCLDGSKPKFSNYLIRWLIRPIDFLFSWSVAIVFVLATGRGQRLGDLAAKTTVISEQRRTGFTKTVATYLPENYQPKYPQVTVFSDEDIQKTNRIFKKAKHTANHKVILMLSDKLSKEMKVEFDEKPIEFVNRILMDYTYFAQQ